LKSALEGLHAFRPSGLQAFLLIRHLFEGRFAALWATHPPMAKRIEALKQMAYQQEGLKAFEG